MERSHEVRKLLQMTSKDVVKEAEGRLVVVDTLDELHRHFARSVAAEIKQNNELGNEMSLILPVGPVGQYPLLAEMINEDEISLANCHFFFMDEYCDDAGHAISPGHPLSFKAEMGKLFFAEINDELRIPEDQVVFPNERNLHLLQERIESAGGIETCYGGIGIHGHVAFNEPEPNVRYTDPRLVYLNQYTITINAIREGIGGDLINFPRKAVTLGMNQICGSRRVRLYCRNDIPGIDWANLVLRLAVLGEPGDDYPVTHLTRHSDYVVVTTRETLECPENVLPLPY